MAVGQQKNARGLGRIFSEHPQSLGMSWGSHAAGAVAISARLVGAGMACLIHAIVPAWFTQTAGKTVTNIYDDMARRKAGAANPDAWPDYEI